MQRKSNLRGLLSTQGFNPNRSSTLSLSQRLVSSSAQSKKVASEQSPTTVEPCHRSTRMALPQECKNPHVIAPYKNQNRHEQKEVEIDVECWRPGNR